MIVRLKETHGGLVLSKRHWFQFYDSPIKSVRQRTPNRPRRGGFQFYDSPIKSAGRKADEVAEKRFQFYDSPIKSIHEFFYVYCYIVSIL